MSKTKYEEKILEYLNENGNKNIYEIFSAMGAKHYSTILRGVKRLEDDKYVEKVGVGGIGQRKSKVYGISVRGLAKLFISKSQEYGNELRYFGTENAKKMLDRIEMLLLEKWQIEDETLKKLISLVIRNSPSALAFLSTEEGSKYIEIAGEHTKKLLEGVREEEKELIEKMDMEKMTSPVLIRDFSRLTLGMDSYLYPEEENITEALLESTRIISQWDEELTISLIHYTLLNVLEGVKKERIDLKAGKEGQIEQFWRYMEEIGEIVKDPKGKYFTFKWLLKPS